MGSIYRWIWGRDPKVSACEGFRTKIKQSKDLWKHVALNPIAPDKGSHRQYAIWKTWKPLNMCRVPPLNTFRVSVAFHNTCGAFQSSPAWHPMVVLEQPLSMGWGCRGQPSQVAPGRTKSELEPWHLSSTTTSSSSSSSILQSHVNHGGVRF